MVTSSSPQEHLEQVFQRLHDQGVIINLYKCEFGVPALQFLGHHLDSAGIRPLEQKLQTIRDFPHPLSTRKLREFLGLVNIYHHFLPHATDLHPLHELLPRSPQTVKTLEWTDQATSAFLAANSALADATLLSHPQPNAQLAIMSDTSDIAVLKQRIGDQWQPISYFSRKFTPEETRYSMFDRELLTIYLAIWNFRRMVEGREFAVFTDHKPMTRAFSSRETPPSSSILPSRLHFADIRHVKGANNPLADALSQVEVNALQLHQDIDFEAMAKAQAEDHDLSTLQSSSSSSSSLPVSNIPIPTSPTTLICDISTGVPRPESFRCAVFDSLPSLSHLGV